MPSKAKWKEKIEAYEQSGMPQSSWSRVQGISLYTRLCKNHVQRASIKKFVLISCSLLLANL